MALPTKTWANYLLDLQAIGEHRGPVDLNDGFLQSLGLVDGQALTDLGTSLFRASFITSDIESQKSALHAALMLNPEVLAICQSLFGVPTATKKNAETVLRSHQFGADLTDRRLGTLLTIMASVDVISYVKGELRVIDSPFAEGVVPPSVFISRETPFSNQLWLTRVLRECAGHIYWLDKHFQTSGLDVLADAADGNEIKEVRVLSLKLEGNSSSRARKKYVALQDELSGKGIAFEWRFIDSKLVRGTHDRWVIGDSTARNLPDVGTIFSGNNSEISRSDHAERLNRTFEEYWAQGVPF